MVSQVSFAGTYKVNNQNREAFAKFQKYSNEQTINTDVKAGLKDEIIKKQGFGNFDYKAEQTLIVPDCMDLDVETFCANNGISYKKYDTKDLLNPASITSRIAQAPKDYMTVRVDVKKLEELAKNQSSNLEHCKSDYNEYYQDRVDTMLKNGDEIPATTLSIYSPSGNEDLKRYVDNYGSNNLNDNQIFIDFEQKTNNPDHCTYFALEDIGIDKVPVYVDATTYEAGNILGLFK